MYAEGDLINLSNNSALYLKDALFTISRSWFFKPLEDDQNIDKNSEERKSSDRKRETKVKAKSENTTKTTLDMPVLQYVFEDSVKRFYEHKNLSKYYVSFNINNFWTYPFLILI